MPDYFGGMKYLSRQKAKSLFKKILLQPAVPFRELWVLDELATILESLKIPYYFDENKNLIANARNAQELKRKKIAFFAHTDHPGFHVTKHLGGSRYEGLWFGGAPFAQMKGSRVRVYDPRKGKRHYPAKIVSLEKEYQRTGLKIELNIPEKPNLSDQAFGRFDFDLFKEKKDLIYTPAADDLAGCLIALGALASNETKKRSHAVAIFTRAEEVGFVGCWAFLKSKKLNPKCLCISLEASRELPGAKIGEGPVLRLGDRSTVFSSTASQFMWKVSLDLQKEDSTAKFQRRLMDGGSCEATALVMHGHLTTGLSVPLGNYHNQGPRGPAPEVISFDDAFNGMKICAKMIREEFVDEQKKMKNGLNKNYVTLKRKLPLSWQDFCL